MPKGVYKHKETQGFKKGNQMHLGRVISNETRMKLSAAHKGKPSGMLGRHHTLEVREKIRLAGIGRTGAMTGKKHSQATIEKMSSAKKGKRPANLDSLHIACRGVPKSAEMRKRISNTLTGKYTNEKSPSWQGGLSRLPYSVDWCNSLRISIRERDKYTCQMCGEKQGDRALCVHHIDYDKKNCNPNNLISLCIGCHNKTNLNRKHWIEYFNLKQNNV